jgi:hypothetical protein
MRLCGYCGQKTGWFQSSHAACVAKAKSVEQTVQKLVFDGALAGRSYDELWLEVQKVLTDNAVSIDYVRDALYQGANDAASQIALKSPISKSECDRLLRINSGLDGTLGKLPSDYYRAQIVPRKWFALGQLGMSYLLWQVLNNVTPDWNNTPGQTVVAFNLRHGEIPIFQTGECVMYAEERTLTNYNRSYQGLSIPVGHGVYYHVGGSHGHQERTSGLTPLDGGRMLVTTKSLYFGGRKTTLRIPLDQVLRYQPYVDGVGVCESYGAPKVFVFDYRGMDAGWFFYNLLVALSKQL